VWPSGTVRKRIIVENCVKPALILSLLSTFPSLPPEEICVKFGLVNNIRRSSDANIEGERNEPFKKEAV
jgi:hypothetical protein